MPSKKKINLSFFGMADMNRTGAMKLVQGKKLEKTYRMPTCLTIPWSEMMCSIMHLI